MTVYTNAYGIAKIEDGQPLADTAVLLNQHADTLEAALIAGGLTPPGASDYAALVGRVVALETSVALLTNRPRAVLRQTTAQTGLATGFNDLFFQAEDVDSHDGHAAGAARWICPVGQAGLYLLVATCSYAALTAAGTAVNVRITKNGTAIAGGTGAGGNYGGNSGNTTTTGPKLLALAAGDQVGAQGYAQQAAWATGVFTDSASTLSILRVT